jgi:hypothetical protein
MAGTCASWRRIIGGDPLDDTKSYAVAMTDFLAFGDTGYTDLQKPAIRFRPCGFMCAISQFRLQPLKNFIVII